MSSSRELLELIRRKKGENPSGGRNVEGLYTRHVPEHADVIEFSLGKCACIAIGR
jgi:hypothetical protein